MLGTGEAGTVTSEGMSLFCVDHRVGGRGEESFRPSIRSLLGQIRHFKMDWLPTQSERPVTLKYVSRDW